MTRILIVEDNPDLAYGLRNNLEIEGYRVEVADDGPGGLERARSGRPDLVILDLMLPEMSGYHVLRRMREDGLEMPVLILTARGEEADKVRGFRMGADDYVTKPFGLLELLARVEALLRRTGRWRANGGSGHEVHRFGDVEVDVDAHRVRKDGEEVSLTPKEFELLCALLRRKGAVASRQDLLVEVWGHRPEIVSRTVDTHIAELRKKVEDEPSDPEHIITVRKVGYRLEA